jgi:Mn-dependent DtxR family transcriptional regulator
VEPTNDQLGNAILRVLYPETNTLGEVKPMKIEALVEILKVDAARVQEMIHYFSEKGWATLTPEGVMLTDAAIWAIRQHERTYCPYL